MGTKTIQGNLNVTGSLKKNGSDVALVSNIPTIDSALSTTSTNPVQNKVINSALASKQQSGNYISYTNNSVSVAGTTKTVATTSPNALYVSNGLIMGGTAAAAGLVTRGICGVSAPTTDGACTKENLYLNYDGTTSYADGRKVVLGAGSTGTALTGGAYTYCAVRGDEMVAYVASQTLSGPTGPTGSVASLSITGSGTFVSAIDLNTTTKVLTVTKSTPPNTTYSFSASNPTLAWGTTSTIGTAGGATYKVTMPANPNTDTHYTAYNYVGAADSASNAATSNGSTYLKLYENGTKRSQFKVSGTGATTVSSDSSGNITISSSNTDTHWTTGLYVGATGVKSNAATTNGSTFIKLYDNDTSRANLKITGSGATTVASDSSGNITITSTNTTYSTATTSINGLMSSNDKSKLDGIASGANNYVLPAATASSLGGIMMSVSGTALILKTA